MKVPSVPCQVLVQLEGKVKAGLSVEQVLTWEDAFAWTAGKVTTVTPQQEMIVLAPRKDLEAKLKERTGGHQEVWKVMLLKEQSLLLVDAECHSWWRYLTEKAPMEQHLAAVE